MSEEPRRKRKWDNQGEDDAAVKKAASGADIQATADNDTGNQDDPSGPAAAAAAAIAAAKLNAMIVAQAKAATEGDTAAESSQTAPDSGEDTAGDGKTRGSNGVVPIREGKERDEFVADIDINDIKHRYILTKGSTQTQLQRETGADVTTRGKYYTDRSEATEKDPPLYLHITAVTQEALDLAVNKITEMIDQAQSQGPLPSQRETFQGPPPRSYGYGGPPRHQSFHARVPIGIESDRTFNVRAKIVGPSGQYVKHVQNETRTRVQLKGRGSGYLEVETGREADEPLFINIIGNSQEDVDEAERLCKDLVETVKGEHERMRSRPPEPYSHSRPYGGGGRSYHNNGYNQRYQGGHHHYQHNYNQHYQPPPPPPGTAAPPVNPPLPPGPPPLPSADQVTPNTPTATAAAASTTDAAAAAAAQGYSYEQYEAYNQYYYQQYYQQYGQYYQQAYAQPGTEQGAEAASATGAPVSSDPALAYYGYAYAPPPPPSEQTGADALSSAEGAVPPPPPPPPPPASDGASQPQPPPPPASGDEV
ncbi:hypothetical protein BGX34_001960 [Mortierella sp. NVP85]|nr:hypothetical protein BGX34_001960 [Mortierella sp. NVP85]